MGAPRQIAEAKAKLTAWLTNEGLQGLNPPTPLITGDLEDMSLPGLRIRLLLMTASAKRLQV